ncbi:hypothetical protein [Maricaulis sp.]|uniref:hypothetical protein n=1 Tax=Maricaulis sp. TaxID=1486257 RepID=UPI0025F51A3E|nr:hypothetical protein [Maricaulis sp.]MDF1767535.1 hypothetical protein [Maricaulis sp.]
MASFAADRDDEAGTTPPRSLAPPPRDSLLDRDVVSLCARQRHLLEFAFRLADHGHTHVGNVLALSRYTLLDLADGEAELVAGLERLLGHLGLELGQPVPGWSSPRPDVIDVQLD